MAELLRLDTGDDATAKGRVPFDLTDFIGPDGPDFGEGAIEGYMADAERGQVMIDFRVPNRTIQVPLQLMDAGELTFTEARQQVQAKAALFQREGGWLERVVGGVSWWADVVNATLKLGASTAAALGFADADAVLTLECRPDFYGDEVALDALSTATAAELVAVLQANGVDASIAGDYSGRVRIVVTDESGHGQLGLLWGIRSRHYDAAATAALAYEAEDLTPLDLATVAAQAGASGGNVVKHAAVASGWTPVLATDLADGGPLTHTGSYRVWARCATVFGSPLSSLEGLSMRLRLVYGVGDLTNPTENSPAALPLPLASATTPFFLVDLGSIRLDALAAGQHRWMGQVQASSSFAGGGVLLDRLWLQPVDESAGRLSAAPLENLGLLAYNARDMFDQAAGALNGKTAPLGGAWTTGGATTDFTVDASAHAVTRLHSDTGTASTGGRYAIAGGAAALTDQAVQVDFQATFGGWKGVLARYVDANNWLLALVDQADDTHSTVWVSKRVAGVSTTLLQDLPRVAQPTGDWFTLRLMVDEEGRWFVWLLPQGAAQSGIPIATGLDVDLSAAGPLASGKPGLYDFGGANKSTYDNFAAWQPASDAVLRPGLSAELRHDGMVHATGDGTAYRPVSHVLGDLPRLPPSGSESRPVELLVKASRGDLDQLPDSAIDDLSVQVFYRPSWLTVPGT